MIDTCVAQEIRIDNHNYDKYLNLNEMEIDSSYYINLKWTEHLKDTIEIKRSLEIIQNAFDVKSKWINNILVINNNYIINNNMLSLGFLRFSITNDKITKRILEKENKKKYKNFNYLALTKYLLIQENNNFLVIFSETSIEPIISGLFIK